MTPGEDSDLVLLGHIQQCLTRIQKYNKQGREEFFRSGLIQDATVRNLQTMSESTQRLSDSIKATEPNIPWFQIAGFRNVLTHGYLEIDETAVWDVIEKDLPALSAAIDRMISKVADAQSR